MDAAIEFLISEAMTSVLQTIVAAWQTPGASEFLAVLLGGTITLAAQHLALSHDRKKQTDQKRDEQKALAWAIFFKISQVHDALTNIANEVREARVIASSEGVGLWQVFQCPAHDSSLVQWETNELVFLIDQKCFDLMQRYQLSTVWLSNLVQSMRIYREMRVEFLSGTPSEMEGTRGSIVVDATNRAQVMPVVAHLQTLSDSIANVVLEQQPEARQLLLDYATAMKDMIGMKPQLELRGEDVPSQL